MWLWRMLCGEHCHQSTVYHEFQDLSARFSCNCDTSCGTLCIGNFMLRLSYYVKMLNFTVWSCWPNEICMLWNRVIWGWNRGLLNQFFGSDWYTSTGELLWKRILNCNWVRFCVMSCTNRAWTWCCLYRGFGERKRVLRLRFCLRFSVGLCESGVIPV